SSVVLGTCIINITPKTKLFFTSVGKSTMNIYIFHIYLVLMLYAIIPKWNIDFMRNTFLILSPFAITYLLSKSKLGTMYSSISNVMNNKVYPKLIIILKKY
ncbi:MAG: hypothetical protein ACRDA5_15535, partial [Clostridium sp.]